MRSLHSAPFSAPARKQPRRVASSSPQTSAARRGRWPASRNRQSCRRGTNPSESQGRLQGGAFAAHRPRRCRVAASRSLPCPRRHAPYPRRKDRDSSYVIRPFATYAAMQISRYPPHEFSLRKGDYGADGTSQSKVPTDQRRGMGVVCPLIRNKSHLTNVHNPRSLLAGIIASKYPSASTDFESSPA